MKNCTILRLYTKLVLFLILTAGSNSCMPDDERSTYRGENSIAFSLNKLQIEDQSDDYIEVKLMLVKALDKELTIDLNLQNADNMMKIDNPKVVLQAGEKTATVLIKPSNLLPLDQNKTIQLSGTTSDNRVTVENAAFEFKKSLDAPVLNERQKELLEIYKNKGLNLYPFIGVVEVEGEAVFPAGGTIDPFTEGFREKINGKTIITLSENATEDKPLLKMERNAMGMQPLLLKLYRKITIENLNLLDVNGVPNFKILKDIKENGVSYYSMLENMEKYDFFVTLDNIALDFNSDEILFTSPKTNAFHTQDERIVVNFNYIFPPWDSLQKRILQDISLQGLGLEDTEGTMDPFFNINYTTINEDYWENGNWKPAKATINKKDNTLKFVFSMDFYNSDEYLTTNVMYKGKSRAQ
ncbi:DUF4929 family protein [Elizabethkingia meningoseptica]|uniref:DUF4929 family protein n=1 Tax=Elizabethkingia meningoseptica TaxID=238 RepID=UPI0023AF2C37|nr:DUF4929 family protein [Elizabethkingia meningoseptica]MDE5490837.1 DUF4929 domain-containing protein [Elizabethkingia meningoseptica]